MVLQILAPVPGNAVGLPCHHLLEQDKDHFVQGQRSCEQLDRSSGIHGPHEEGGTRGVIDGVGIDQPHQDVGIQNGKYFTPCAKSSKVILQTPEVVRLVLLGGSRRTFSTSDFLAQSPTVLSTGFRLAVQFGIDYRHQALSTREIPTRLASRLGEELSRAGYEKDLHGLQVEFEEAGASALTLRVLADFAGAAAPSYEVLHRVAVWLTGVMASSEAHPQLPSMRSRENSTAAASRKAAVQAVPQVRRITQAGWRWRI